MTYESKILKSLCTEEQLDDLKNSRGKTRADNARYSANYRKNNPGKWKNYFNAYWREYYAKNKRAHALRTILSGIKNSLQKMKARGLRRVDFDERNQIIYSNLKSVGWNWKNPKHSCNHIVSVYWLLKFDKNLDATIIYDVLNLEVVNRKSNSSYANRVINDEVLFTAMAMEEKFPVELAGLTDFLRRHVGEVR